jgi:hypothetical protein
LLFQQPTIAINDGETLVRIKTILAALAGALCVSAAMATSLQRMSLDELAAEASVAVVGAVTASRSVQTADGAYTVSAVAGAKFRVGENVAGAALLVAGKPVLLLLSRDEATGELAIVGFDQGKMDVVDTAEGAIVMMPGSKTGTLLGDAVAKLRAMHAASAASQN